MYSLFDSFFAPPTIVVVSEERLKAAELKAKKDQLTAVNVRINDTTDYRDTLTKEIAKLDPQPESLEEALLGE